MKISDEAVEAAQKAWTKAYWTEATPGKADWMHAALAAAVPYLMPDREAILRVLEAHKQGLQPSGARCCSCGWTERPYGSLLWTPDEWRDHLADALANASEVPSDQPS